LRAEELTGGSRRQIAMAVLAAAIHVLLRDKMT
jgi:hypothetical protein